ncbi:HEAT repeat domain-containing protein [Flavobacterium amnicola]|uniref:HEAT repeat domain-containing protein n=1 Tax=Flavobacterium amnicola TaxID=2506422 RepID=A0A4Q1K030_9FLAO|nr:HEAT repeat domain-containing protein [Flavobacterium amnicola]RXR17225.1 HEAT repeat domain-containing protein [Flavobacterium amnicola]
MKLTFTVFFYMDYKSFLHKLEGLDNAEICHNLSQLSSTFSITNFLNYHLKNLTKLDYYFPIDSSSTRYKIDNTSYFELSLIILDNAGRKNPKKLYSNNSDVFFCPLFSDQNNNSYSIYSQKKSCQPNILLKDSKLEIIESNILKSNVTIFIEKFYNLIRFENNSPVYFLSLTKLIDYENFIWEYDTNTLAPIRLISTDQNDNRLISTLKILSEIGNQDSLDFIHNTLQSNENHSIRWEALKALINLDYDSGIIQLKKMLLDSHPEIQKAAKESLKLLNSENANTI